MIEIKLKTIIDKIVNSYDDTKLHIRIMPSFGHNDSNEYMTEIIIYKESKNDIYELIDVVKFYFEYSSEDVLWFEKLSFKQIYNLKVKMTYEELNKINEKFIILDDITPKKKKL